jgi:hypothetical protein
LGSEWPGQEGTTTMRTAMLAFVMLATVIPSLGCSGARSASGGCQGCGGHGPGCIQSGFFARYCGAQTRATPAQEGAGAPSSAQVGYPYYTNRGPRDFLVNDPPSIGQ